MVKTYHIKDGNLEIKEHEKYTVVKLYGWRHNIDYINKSIKLEGSVECDFKNFSCTPLYTSLFDEKGIYKTDQDILSEVIKHVEREIECYKLDAKLDKCFKQIESKLIVFEIEAIK